MNNKTFKSGRYDLAIDTISEEDVEQLIRWLGEYP